jgi:hypothetical protein
MNVLKRGNIPANLSERTPKDAETPKDAADGIGIGIRIPPPPPSRSAQAIATSG